MPTSRHGARLPTPTEIRTLCRELPVVDRFRGPFFFLSNMCPAPLTWRGRQLPASENAYQAEKDPTGARLAEFIGLDPFAAKQLGRALGLDPEQRRAWRERRLSVMTAVLAAKFADPALRELLLATGQTRLVEGNSHGDSFWGQVAGRGHNHLGELLMALRAELRGPVPTVILTSFKRQARYPGAAFSVARFQPAGCSLPELGFFAALDAQGQKLTLASCGHDPALYCERYRAGLKARWPEIAAWLAGLEPGATLKLACWCPHSEPSGQGGEFFCHTGLIGRLLNRHAPDVRLLLDRERVERLAPSCRPAVFAPADVAAPEPAQLPLFPAP